MSFLTALGFGLIGPALPALAALFSIPAVVASLAISGFAAVRLATNLALGGLLARFRLRLVLIAGLLVQAVCSIIAGLASDGVTFLVFRALSGLGSAALTLSATALIIALVDPSVRGRAMGIYFGAGSLGVVIGPAIGGLVAIADARLPLLLYGACLAVAAVIATLALRGARHVKSADADEDEVRQPSGTVLRTLLRDPRFLLALACQMVIGWTLYGMYVTTIPLALGAVGLTTALIGLLMTTAAGAEIVGATGAGTASDRIGRIAPLLTGLLIGVVGLALVVDYVQADADRPWFALIPAFLLIGAAAGTLGTVPAALLADVPLGGSGPGVAAYWIVFDISAIVGPLVAGLIADRVSFSAALLTGEVPLLIAIAMAVALAVRGRRRGQATDA